ncbi:lytic polysaccharide monooxygenase [Streptomyces ficellus]|uniref:Lytic polysaccharide monooxygenase n=1 Tax=Streptomyces ficellus TaxID=1977088 RepID=A0ABT7Z1X2_9ACTN|nr:lytic polysaccharide monooxygenase [Streptomyces ficellus]MDN3293494.1 lytic polysaccharide monooxygenase [Streptomyces ficellus]
MTARSRHAAAVVVLGAGPLVFAGLAATPALAHGSMTDPVSRVSACYAEGPESPDSAACKAAVAASGAQAFYDWNEVNIANAAGNHKRLIPDGKLCSANRDKYQGLDLARADWPASPLTSGPHTFRYKATAPHKGSFELYITKDGYDPAKALTWSDLEAKPFAKVTNPRLENGAYVFDGTVPAKSGRHLVYSIWQRSDSPEAFYTCSDVVFGKDSDPAPTASAPSEEQIEDGASQSTVDHGGHGGDDHAAKPSAPATPETPTSAAAEQANAPEANGASSPSPAAATTNPTATTTSGNLAETGGDGTTPYLAVGGAAVLAIGAAVLFGAARRRAR